jgi:uncharacterized protein YjbI with pentapeptide repeats
LVLNPKLVNHSNLKQKPRRHQKEKAVYQAERNLENRSLENRSLDNRDLENRDLDNRSLDNRDLENRSLDNRSLENRDLDNSNKLLALEAQILVRD